MLFETFLFYRMSYLTFKQVYFVVLIGFLRVPLAKRQGLPKRKHLDVGSFTLQGIFVWLLKLKAKTYVVVWVRKRWNLKQDCRDVLVIKI